MKNDPTTIRTNDYSLDDLIDPSRFTPLGSAIIAIGLCLLVIFFALLIGFGVTI